MSINLFPALNDNLNKKILDKKEFLSFKKENSQYEITYIDEMIKKNNLLLLTSYQSFINNFISPNTPYNRLLLNFTTGSGKTITSLMTAHHFKKINQDSNIIIIGFTKNIFKHELASNRNFDILSNENIERYKADPNDISINILLNKELHKKKYYLFGYKEFFNKLFSIDESITHDNFKRNELIDYIKTQKITVNKNVLDLFANSLLICDEIHNLYNKQDQNNWGFAIEFVLDYFTSEKIKQDMPVNFNSLKSLFLSATPITHKATEIVYLLNLLNNQSNKVTKSQLFKNGDMLVEADSIIKSLSYGKISYMNTMSSANFPKKEFMGRYIDKDSKLLKFVFCDSSNFYYNTYKHVINAKINIDLDKLNDADVFEAYKNIKLGLQYKFLTDCVFPNPDDKTIGLYDFTSVNSTILKSDAVWKKRNNIYINKNGIITGQWLRQDNIKNYSPKYFNMIEIILDAIRNKKGKIMVFHPYIMYTGVSFIAEILINNNIIGVDSIPSSNTICSICSQTLNQHSKIKEHDFKPVRFALVTGNMTKNNITDQINKFNEENNKHGDEIKILLGSSVIKESYTVLSVQTLIIPHVPVNISTLMQIIGRVVRFNSHSQLPLSQRKVFIHLLVNNFTNVDSNITHSFNILSYKNKINEFLLIDKINNIMYNNAVDYYINKDINNFTNVLFDELNYSNKDSKTILVNPNSSDTNTFIPYFLNKELSTIEYMIKRLFLEEFDVWRYDDLYESIKTFKYRTDINPAYISKDSFNIALNNVVYKKTNIIYKDVNKTFGELLLNNNEYFLDKNNRKVIIYQHNDYYILRYYNKRHTDIEIDDILKYKDINTDIKETHININNLLLDIKLDYISYYEKILNDISKGIYFVYNYSVTVQINLLEHTIESNTLIKKYKSMIDIYDKYGYILYEKSKIVGHCLNLNNYRIYDENGWKNVNRESTERYPIKNVIAYHSISNDYIIFKIKYAKDLANETDDKRTITKGHLCINIDLVKLEELIKMIEPKMEVESSVFKNKTQVCNLIEFLILNRNSKKNKLFYNLNEYNYYFLH